MLPELFRNLFPRFLHQARRDNDLAELENRSAIQEKIQAKIHAHIISGVDVNSLWGDYQYSDNMTLEENIIQAIETANFNTTEPVTFVDLDFRVSRSRDTRLPPLFFPSNIFLDRCKLTEGELVFHDGTLYLTGDSTKGTALGDRAEIIAGGDYSIATVLGTRSTANLHGFRSIGCAEGPETRVHAYGNEAVGFACGEKASAHAHGARTKAVASGNNTFAVGEGVGVEAFAVGRECTATVSEPDAIGYGEGDFCTVFVEDHNAFGILKNPSAMIKAKSKDAFLISTLNEHTSSSVVTYHHQFKTSEKNEEHEITEPDGTKSRVIRSRKLNERVEFTDQVVPISRTSIANLGNGYYGRLKLAADKGSPVAKEWLDRLIPSRLDRFTLAMEYKRRSLFDKYKGVRIAAE